MSAGRKELKEFLEAQDITVTVHLHEPVFTVDESASLHEKIPGGHSKNLFLRDRKSNYFLIVACHDTEIDLKGLHRAIGASGRLSFGKPDKLMELLGVTPGAVSPFCLINDREHLLVSAFFDSRLQSHALLNFHPLRNDETWTISQENLARFSTACGHGMEFVTLGD